MQDTVILDRIGRIEMRVDCMIRGVDKLAEISEATNDKLDELLEWAQQPPSTELSDTLMRLSIVVSGLNDAIVELGRQLPGRVAEAVQAGR